MTTRTLLAARVSVLLVAALAPRQVAGESAPNQRPGERVGSRETASGRVVEGRAR